MDVKKCNHCKEMLSVSEFHKSSREKDGLQQWCKHCRKSWKHEERKEYHRNRYHNDKDSYNDWVYKRKYGISLDEYNRMLEEQKGVCAICSEECLTGKRLSVDHCHSTGVVRGLLCGNCNKGLGNFQDNESLLEIAINYLRAKR